MEGPSRRTGENTLAIRWKLFGEQSGKALEIRWKQFGEQRNIILTRRAQRRVDGFKFPEGFGMPSWKLDIKKHLDNLEIRLK